MTTISQCTAARHQNELYEDPLADLRHSTTCWKSVGISSMGLSRRDPIFCRAISYEHNHKPKPTGLYKIDVESVLSSAVGCWLVGFPS